MIDALLQHFDAILGHALATAAQPVKMPAGTILFSRGSPCRQFLVLLEGVVRVQAFSAGGREIVLYRLHPGESCVMTTACLLGRLAYPAEGVAETAIRGAIVPDHAFERLLADSPAFRHFAFGTYAARLVELVSRVQEVALERIDARLAHLLLELAPHAGDVIARTHQSLAADLGSAREVVSRQLKNFELHGWVALRRGRILVLDRRALENLSWTSR